MVAVVAVTAQASASAAEAPEHGVNETTYHKLWSGDVDTTNASQLQSLLGTNASPTEILAAGTDIPFSSPPLAVEQWNSDDVETFPRTNGQTVIHPTGASFSQGSVIKDAFIEIFAVQPSTRARLSPGEATRYVAPTGQILAVADYRVEEPLDDTEGSIQTRWQILDHQINETRLFVDGQLTQRQGGSRHPTVAYSLGSYPGDAHTLEVAVNVTITLHREVRICRIYGNDSNCIDWWTMTDVLTNTVTARDSVDVTTYDLSISGYRTRYPNGDLGLVVYKNKPWLGYSVPGSEVNGVWRFYSARDSRWDRLVERTATDAIEIESSV